MVMCKVYFVLSCYLLGPGGKGERDIFELATPYLNTWKKTSPSCYDCSMCFKCLWQKVRASYSNAIKPYAIICNQIFMTMVMMMMK